MRFLDWIARWLESHWVTPAYSGWVLFGTALFFFGAASNTMAGWLYVISGVMLALLSIASMLPQRALKGLIVSRQSLHPVTAGQALMVEVTVANETPQSKSLLQLRDHLPAGLGPVQEVAIATIPPQAQYRWFYEIPTQRRGIYRWQTFQLRTGAPLGLFWCSREQSIPAKAIVYPQILPLTQCPIIDALGHQSGVRWRYDRTAQTGNEGLTRALRPYRWGDPTRLIHWRTSARYGELRVRELEQFSSNQEIVVALDTAARWDSETFEQAVVAAASLYSYALKQGLAAQLWSPQTGLVMDRISVLTALADIQSSPTTPSSQLPSSPLIWLSSGNPQNLPSSSRQILFPVKTAAHSYTAQSAAYPGVVIDPHKDLQQQLQSELVVSTR